MINKQKRWSDWEIQYLIDNYPKTPTSEMAEKLGRTIHSVKVKASRIGLKKPSHYQDNNYFNLIDTSEKAYWLGFITADGYVVNNEQHRNHELGIEIGIKDINHLKKFASAIKTDQEVGIRKKTPFINKGYDKEYNMCFLRLYSKSLVESLEKYNIVQNKTYDLVFPSINDKYVWDYIRGYFDGDGCVFNKNVYSTSGNVHSYYCVSFVCKCDNYLRSLSSILDSYGIDSSLTKDRSYFVLFIRKQDSVTRFFDLLYSRDDCVKLERKYNRYKNIYQYNKLPS